MDLRGFGLDDDDLAALGYRVRRESPQQDASKRWTPSPGPVDPSWRTWAATLAALVLTVWGASTHRWLPPPVPANHPDTAFSSARAMSQLAEIARLPRPIGSPEHARVREHLTRRLEALGLETHVRTVTMASRDGAHARSATVRNVVARLRGSDPTGSVLLTAHYDGPPLAPAAGDGGAGLVTVLETVRAVAAGPPLRNDLVVVLADGGETGMLGARAFVEHHPWMDEVGLAMSVETWGVAGASLLLGPGPGSGPVARVVAESNPLAAVVPLPARVMREAPEPDIVPFRDGGVRTLSFTATSGRALHARPGEVPAAMSEETVQHHGVQLLAMTRAFGRRDLADPSRLDTEEHVRVRVPWVGVLHYPVGRTLTVSLALLAGWCLVALALRYERSGTRRGVTAGVVMAAAAVGGAAAAAGGVFARLRDLHPEYGRLGSAFYEEGLHLLALVWLSVAIVMALYALARRWFGSAELIVGALAVPIAAVTGLALRDPAAAAPLQWPLVFPLLACLLLAASGRGRRPGLWEWIVYTLLAVGSLALLVPFVEVLADALTLRWAPLLAASVAACALTVLPVGEWLLRPRAWCAPVLAAGLAAALLAAGLPAVLGGAKHPLPTSLVYLVEQPAPAPPTSGAAQAALPGGVPPARSGSVPVTSTWGAASRHLIGSWLTVPGPGEAWSRSWVAHTPAGSTAPGLLLLPGGERYEVAGTGPASDVAPPRVRVARDVLDGDWRTLDLAVYGGLGGEMLGVHLPADGGAAITGVGGVEWDGTEEDAPVLVLTHWGVPSTDALPIRLRVEAGRRQLALHVVEHHLRPAEVLGPGFYERSDSVAPDPSTGSDRVIQRTRVVLPLAGPGRAGTAVTSAGS